MDKTQKTKAEKLQVKLGKLLETKDKRQTAFDKAKQELNATSKEVESTKLKLFEILQSGSDDFVFSSWAKKKITEKSDNGDSANSEKTEKPVLQNQHSTTEQKPQSPIGQNQQSHTTQNQNRPNHQNQNPNQSQSQNNQNNNRQG